jgi:polycystin 1L2
VRIVITGEEDETRPRLLDDAARRPFRRAGTDSFVMGVTKPLGNLNWIRVWHDNTGIAENASWYLKHIVIHDVQTREKFYFVCEKWLAVEKSDGRIDRTICASNLQDEKKNLAKKFLINLKHNMNDNHLWTSTLTKPKMSNFTRMDRVTCIFVLIYLIMIFHILFIEIKKETDAYDKFGIGAYKISPKKVNFNSSFKQK